LFFYFVSVNLHANEARQYVFKNDPIDVVIVSHPKDKPTIDLCIDGIRNNCKVNRIIVVSPKKLTDKAEWFHENKYPFSKEDVAFQIGREDQKKTDTFFKHGHPPGWYYQQLLKLYAAYVIPSISSNVLIIDADSVFMNPVKFLGESFAGLLCTSRNRTTKGHYVDHASRLIPNYKRVNPNLNSVHHHMLFQKAILDDLFADVEKKHGLPFWKAFCRCIDLSRKGASEYEIYYNYALTYCKDVKLRALKRRSSGKISKIPDYKKDGYHMVSFHSYMRK
jgi:hypothetical protein